jgi:hypothetical protein
MHADPLVELLVAGAEQTRRAASNISSGDPEAATALAYAAGLLDATAAALGRPPAQPVVRPPTMRGPATPTDLRPDAG